jgi:hypothetical protein
MDDGISVFHSGVRIPPSVYDFNIIPKRHYDWFLDTFKCNNRSVPPLPDSTAPAPVPKQIIALKSSDQLTITDYIKLSCKHIYHAFRMFGFEYYATDAGVFMGDKFIFKTPPAEKIQLANTSNGYLIVSTFKNNKCEFYDYRSTAKIGSIQSDNIFARNNCIYSISNGKLIENSFKVYGDKIVHIPTEIENISEISSQMFDGCIIQNLLGKKYVTVTYKMGASVSKYIKELDTHRIVDEKSERDVLILTTEHKNIYYRYIIIFNIANNEYTIREVKDVAYERINFAVLDNGIVVYIANDSELEIFHNVTSSKVISNPPIDSEMPLLNLNNKIYFIDDNGIYNLSTKK